MRRIISFLLVLVISLAGVFWWVQSARGQVDGERWIIKSEAQDGNQREISANSQLEAPSEPNIGFINSPSAVCFQPDPGLDECRINWYYLSVSASPNYMIAMTVTLQTRHAATVSGFFQTSMYVPYDMLGDGFKVACGPLGAGGNPTLGRAYSYTIRARDSANLGSANYGTVYCPAFIP